MSEGYENEVQHRAFCWALDLVRRYGTLDRETAAVGAGGFAAVGQGFAAIGGVLLRTRQDGYRYQSGGALMEALQKVVDSDPYLAHDKLVLTPGKQELIHLGKVVEGTDWWKMNAENVKKARRDLKKVREVQES
jgi:hypothetical protein